jgi:hypothetical protein
VRPVRVYRPALLRVAYRRKVLDELRRQSG